MPRPALSASRAALIITFLTGEPARMFTMAEIMKATGINVSSCFAILKALVASGFLVRDETRKSYALGPAMAAAGIAALKAQPVIASARRAALELARDLDVAALLSTRLGADQLILDSVVSGQRAFDVTPGQRLVLTPPLGAHLVAWEPDEIADRWIGQAAPDDALALRWRETFRIVRERGYHVSLHETGKASASHMMELLGAFPQHAGTSEDTIAIVNDLGWDFLALRAFSEDELYSVSTIAAPVGECHRSPPLCITIGRFGRRLSGREIGQYSQNLVAACRGIEANDVTAA